MKSIKTENYNHGMFRPKRFMPFTFSTSNLTLNLEYFATKMFLTHLLFSGLLATILTPYTSTIIPGS